MAASQREAAPGRGDCGEAAPDPGGFGGDGRGGTAGGFGLDGEMVEIFGI